MRQSPVMMCRLSLSISMESPVRPRSRLEEQLQRQLLQARKVVLALGQLSEAGVGEGAADRAAANHGIGNVEGLGAELKGIPLAPFGVLDQRDVALRRRRAHYVGDRKSVVLGKSVDLGGRR